MKDLKQSIERLAKEKAKLLIDRKINIQMRKELHHLANDQARWELILDGIKNFKWKKYSINEWYIPFKEEYPSDGMKDVVYVLGDIHYRGEIDKKHVLKLFRMIKQDIKQHKYKSVDLWFTGDNIDGEIHNEQQRSNDPVVDQVNQISNLFVECINQIKEIKNVKFVYGNHEEIRLWGDKGTQNNAGKLIQNTMKMGLRKNISFQVGNTLSFDYKDKRIFLLHGHQGYASNKQKLLNVYSTKNKSLPDIIVMGHFHTAKVNQYSKNSWLIVNPAIKNFESEWDKANGYCGFGQCIKLKLNTNELQYTIMNIK